MPVVSCGRSLYIDWRMVVVVWGKCPTPCKKGGRIVRAGEKSGVTCPWGYVRGKYPDPLVARGGALRDGDILLAVCLSQAAATTGVPYDSSP